MNLVILRRIKVDSVGFLLRRLCIINRILQGDALLLLVDLLLLLELKLLMDLLGELKVKLRSIRRIYWPISLLDWRNRI
jgi:hypothetical protein